MRRADRFRTGQILEPLEEPLDFPGKASAKHRLQFGLTSSPDVLEGLAAPLGRSASLIADSGGAH